VGQFHAQERMALSKKTKFNQGSVRRRFPLCAFVVKGFAARKLTHSRILSLREGLRLLKDREDVKRSERRRP
jgi:hypothetical protein